MVVCLDCPEPQVGQPRSSSNTAEPHTLQIDTFFRMEVSTTFSCWKSNDPQFGAFLVFVGHAAGGRLPSLSSSALSLSHYF